MTSTDVAWRAVPAAAKPAIAARVGGRVVQIDMMRFVAFATIATIHVSWVDTRDVGARSVLLLMLRYSLPFFFMTSGWFAARHLGDDVAYLRRVILRLGGLFVVWELVFNAIHFFVHDLGYRPMPTTAHDAIVYLAATLNGGGVAFHLWFLPWLAVSITIFLGLARLGWTAVWIGTASLYVIGLAVGPYNEFTGVFDVVARIYPDPLAFTARNGPFFGPLFVAFGAWFARRQDLVAQVPRGVAPMVVIFGFLLFAGEAIFISRHGVKMVANFNFLVGSVIFAPALFVVILRAPVDRVTTAMARLGRHGLGMYCLHALFTLLYNQAHPAATRLDMPVWVSLVQAAWVVALSAGLALLLARIPVLRRFVL
ncbi:MAG: acyltransferase [Phyllobacteriaceae bacterium]|nr:acyltransferase [Phyllobacteriaceae bacterium]